MSPPETRDNRGSPSWEDEVRGWRRLSDEVEARKNLAVAAAFVTGFELLRQMLTDLVRDSCVMPGLIGGQARYETEVLQKHGGQVSGSGRVLRASLGWLTDNGAFDADEAESVERLAEFRNYLAHRLFDFLLHGDRSICVQHIACVIRLLGTLETWCGQCCCEPVWPMGMDDVNLSEAEIPTPQANIVRWLAQAALNSAEISDTELRELFE